MDFEIPKLILEDDTFDVYIRMKKSSESDFCFEVNDKTTFRDLFKIFTTVPMVFSPSIFYDKIPIGFKVSNYPGLLTRTGGILFEADADKEEFLINISNLDNKIKDNCLPGQLIIPVFKERTFLHHSIISLLLIWLYTDLPDFISPTPGICLTNYFTDLVVYILREYLNKHQQADIFYNDVHSPVGEIGQLIYFSFHIFKISLFYFILWAGLFNPYSWKKPSLANLSREDLLAVGWTGIKKSLKQGYQDAYRKKMTEKYGSIINIYNNGKLLYIRECFVTLNKGEGYDKVNKLENNNNNNSFILTAELLNKERQFLNDSLSKLPYKDAYDLLKKYRQSGPLNPCKELADLTEARFKELNEEIAAKDEKAKHSKKNE
ncbi:glucose repression protein [Pichia californica]|uniref:Glucose repression protein n=1 Tax=Pichia californica TaxID=460514 RepID=A0A9P7BI43_9ASCO|nr:glucose repression protein [[Candida] californica]